MNLSPKYSSFLTRVWFQVNRTILLLIIVIIPIILINGIKIVIGINLGIIPITILLIFRSFVVSRYYLKSLDINEDKKYILLETVEYNKKTEQHKISLEDVNVKINQVLYSFRPYYKLQFYRNKEMIFQQRECKEWTRSTLVEIYDKVKNMKGQYSHKGKASDDIVKGAKNSINNDISSGTFSTLNNAEKNILRQTQTVVNSQGFEAGTKTVLGLGIEMGKQGAKSIDGSGNSSATTYPLIQSCLFPY